MRLAIAAWAAACSGPDKDPPDTAATTTAPFVVDDAVLSEISILDPEFDEATQRITWQDPDGASVWVIGVEELMAGASATEVATNVFPFEEMHNGPEWMRTENGSALLFSRFEEEVPWFVIAEEDTTGAWTQRAMLSGRGGFGTGDGSPATVAWLDESTQMNWSRVDGSDTDTFMSMKGKYRPWFIAGTSWLLHTDRRDGFWQTIRQDTNTKEAVQLTACPLGCVHGNLAWSDALQDWLLVAVELDEAELPLRLVVLRDEGSGWQIIRTIEPPERQTDRGPLPYILSPEAFSYSGQVWVAFSLSETAGFEDLPSEIWLAGVDPGNEVMRRVSGEVPMVRKDPEFLIGPQTTWIFYSEEVEDQRTLHRCASGLTP